MAGRFFRPGPGRYLLDLAGQYARLETQLQALYACPDCSALPNLAGDDDWVNDMFSDDELDDFIRNVRKGKYKDGSLDKKRVSKYASKLTEGVEKGFGKSLGKVDYDTPDAEMLRKLAANVFHFSAAKNRAEIISLSEALVNPATGKLRPFEEFRREASKILTQFQGTWLRTEYDMAVGAATMAARWMEYSEDPDTILVYRTAGDKRVREAHQALDGIAKKVSDPFWDIYYPPNGWNCRCDVETSGRSKETPGDAPAGAIDGVPPMFRSNFAKEGMVFPPGHPYNPAMTPLAQEQAAAMQVDPLFAQRLPGKKGGYVDIHAATDQNKKQEHIAAAQVLADKGNQIKLMPEIHINDPQNRQLYFPELAPTNGKNPDARFNGKLGDFKIPDSNPVSGKAIQNAIKETANKQVGICAISLLNRQYSNQDVLSKIRGSLKNPKDNPSIEEIWIIGADKSVLKIPRGLIMHKDFWKLIKTL